MHSYRVDNGSDSSPVALASVADSRKSTWSHIADNVAFTELRSLIVYGGDLESKSIISMLRNSPRLESVDMRDVNLTNSPRMNWGSIFSQMSSESTAELRHVYLDNLFEDVPGRTAYIACFTPGLNPGDSIETGETARARTQRSGLAHWDFHRPSAKGFNAFELHRREDVSRGISYQTNPQYVVGSVQNSMWMQQRRRLYSVS